MKGIDSERERPLAKGSRRRQRKLWTDKEVELLRQSVAKYGAGKWATIIKNEPSFSENGRTQVDLKDKWRNLTIKKSPMRSSHKGKSPVRRACRGRTPSPMRSAEFTFYTIQGCGYCSDVKDMVTKAGRAFCEVKVTTKNQEEVYKVTDPLTKRYRYFPMIFRYGKFIGGYAELKKLSL